MGEPDVFGPIEFALLGFPEQADPAPLAAALRSAVEAGLIQIYDILAIRKAGDGSVLGVELSDLDGDGVTQFSAFAGARSGLLDDDDVANAGAELDEGALAVLLVYENLWALPIVAAVHEQGGGLVASTTVSVQNIVDRLDALDASGPTNSRGA